MYSVFNQQTWKPKGSVKVRFALGQGILISLIIGLLAVTLYFPVRSRMVTITNQSYRILSENLASSIFYPYQSDNRQEVINAVRNVERQQGVKYVLIIDKENKVYYDSLSGDLSLEGKTFTPDSLTEAAKKGDTAVGKVVRNNVSYYNFLAPFSTNQTSYSVRLGVDQDIIDGQFIRLVQLFIYMAVFGILLGIIGTYIMATRLTKPIIKLTESALAIRAGNLNAYPDIETNDELEQLSREFQNMVEKLKQFYFQEFSQKKQALDAKKRLEEINNRLNELDHQKSDFLNAASHQLRTPLSVIHWSLSLIIEDEKKLKIPKQYAELLDDSLISTKRMVDLVNELLDISRIEQGRKELNWAKGNYGKVCAQLVKGLQALAIEKKLELTFAKKGNIPDSFLDEKSFYQVINNFVDNAVKYTAKGHVQVSVEADRADANVIIKIADTGIGMDDEEKRNLFTRFSRGQEATKMFANGSGLGMYVAQSILRQHGGNIEVDSQKGEGTTFTLTMPIYAKIPQKAVPNKEAEANQNLERQLKKDTPNAKDTSNAKDKSNA